MIQIPAKIPGLQWTTILLGVYSAVWISLEGNLGQTVLLGVWVTAVSLGYIIQKRWGGKNVTWKQWVGGTAVFGILMGLGSSSLTLFFMALKTGLHSHGPEFTSAEITWVIQQIPLWGLVGLLAGLGVGLLLAGRQVGK